MAPSVDEITLSDLASAGLVVSRRIADEAAAEVDLLVALRASRTFLRDLVLKFKLFLDNSEEWWPSLVEVAENQELPPVLIERYNAAGGEGTALCGIFPEINRAWASVDTSLFLWHFNKRDGQCTEYDGSEQAICAVGFVKPLSGTFVETIKYLLVIATSIEILLVGVCYTCNSDRTDPDAEVSLQTLPEYRISSDGVVITAIASTEKGRIFMGGRDGHVYELQYSRGLRWQSQCRKICITSGLSSLVSRWIMPNVLKIGAVDPVVDLIVDNERHILYARTEDMKIQVFDMGVNGDAAVKRIAEEKGLLETHDGKSDRASRVTKACITCMSPLSTSESKLLHLVAVLSDGRRLYLSTLPVGNNDVADNLNLPSSAQRRPCCLEVLETRSSPPFGISGFGFGAISAAARAQPNDFSLKVEAAFSSAGTTVLSHSSTPAVSSLMIINKDSSLLKLLNSTPEITGRSSHALFEVALSLPLEGRMLVAADVFPMFDLASSLHALYSDTEDFRYTGLRYSCQKAFRKLSARGDLSIQHILPQRRVAVFSTMGVREVVFNRPIEVLRRMLESNAPRFQVKDFLNHFGAGEAAAMCLILAAKLLYTEETPISTIIAERAEEILEDSSIGTQQLDSTVFLKTEQSAGVSSMEQVCEDEPLFSSVHQGILLCSSRLLFPIWERPVFIECKEVGSGAHSEGPVICRLPVAAMGALGNKIHSLEQFVRCRRNQRQGLYGHLSTLVDIRNHTSSDVEACLQTMNPSILTLDFQNSASGHNLVSNKPRVSPQNAVQLIAMEVKAIECLRVLLQRSGEALFLLQVVSSHHLSHVVKSLNSSLQKRLTAMTFSQLVCSEEGQQLAIQLISGLMECCIRLDGQKAVDDLSMKLKKGSPSYYDDSISKYFQAVECLDAASRAEDSAERERLARNAYNLLTKFPECADLSTVCKRFEDLRFYEAVVCLPLRKAQALDPNDDALNDKIDPRQRDNALAKRENCYNMITNVLRALKGQTGQKGPQEEFDSSLLFTDPGSEIEQASRENYIRQVVQLSVKWPDTVFHEHLYRELIDLGLEDELLEYGGPDLVLFLQSAGRELAVEIQAVTSITSATSGIRSINGHSTSCQTKYLDLLARYYVLKRQHILAAHVLYRLAERQCPHLEEGPSLAERHQYLSNAVLQANKAISTGVLSTMKIADDELVDMLEAKLAVLQFQIRIKEELESMVTELENLSSSSASPQSSAQRNLEPFLDPKIAKYKANELLLELKSITQLYNDYAVPFRLWEICLEMLSFASCSGESDNKIVHETWNRLLDQTLSRGGVSEACSVLKRLGPKLYLVDGACLPLETLCLHLETAALERTESGVEILEDKDIATSLLAVCMGAHEVVLNVYDQLLSNAAILSSATLRLRLLRSVLMVLHDWAVSALSHKVDSSTANFFLICCGAQNGEQKTRINHGIRDKIGTMANRYTTEVRRLALPQSQTETVYQGFRKLEEKLLSPT